VGHLLRRSKNLSSVLSSANSAGSLSPSSSLSSSSSESASAPNGFELVLPRVLGAVAEAKLVRPPPEPAPPKPPLNPEKPEPNAAKPEGLEAAANPVAAGFAVSAGVDSVDDLKIEGVEAPNDPKGDCSELANAAKLDEAKAEDDVAGFSSSADFEVDAEPPIEPNGDTEDVFAKALGRGAYREVSFLPAKRNGIQ
jgi:hypothetical protein